MYVRVHVCKNAGLFAISAPAFVLNRYIESTRCVYVC